MSPESKRKRSEPVAAPPLKQHLLWARSDDCDGALGGRSMTREMTVDGVRISDDSDCYVIAEIGHNHQGNLRDGQGAVPGGEGVAGVDAVKLQKRDNRLLFTREMYDKPYDNENSYGEHLRRAPRVALEFGRDEYVELQRLREGARHHLLRHRLRHPERRLPRRARRAGLQDRLRRPHQHPPAPARRRASASR